MESQILETIQKEECAKSEFEEVKNLLWNTRSMISKAQLEYREAQMQCSKKTNDLLRLEEDQIATIQKVNANVENLRQTLFLRRHDLKVLEKKNAELKEELQRSEEATNNLTAEFAKEFRDLNDQITDVDEALDKTKEVVELCATVPDSFSYRERSTFAAEMLRRKAMREEDIKEEMKSLQESIIQVENQILAKKEELARIKDTHSNLNARYRMIRMFKPGQ